MAAVDAAALEALRSLSTTEPPLWLTPNSSLSETARAGSQHIFASLRPFAPKSPFDNLLIEGFDAEQIWQQIDLQSQPLISGLKREIKKLEKSKGEISGFFGVDGSEVGGESEEEFDSDDDEEEDGDDDAELDDEEEEEEEEGRESGSDEEVREGGGEGGIEDGFLKINELEEFMEEDEAREYGLERGPKKKKNKKKDEKADEDDDEEEEDDEELGLFGEDDHGKDMDEIDDARYEDFFTSKKNDKKRKFKTLAEESDDNLEMDDEQDEDENENNISTQQKELNDLRSKVNLMEKADMGKHNLSTHEKELEKLRAKMQEMEKEMLDPKPWTMQGEVTAAQRPKNSALEVDLDFEHNVRPAPVITEEVKASLEEMIQRRILEGQFDDVQKPHTLPTKAPREYKELDESKSKKGLAELYEEEYVQKTDPAFTPISFSDELKNEASMLFKKLCLQLDALSHFHFTPKPVIEDMSIQANVPALAMEEIAPLAVSDATMLAPEEVFAGKGDVKEETELTQEERKRRRARKKRKNKAESVKRTIKKSGATPVANHDNGKN